MNQSHTHTHTHTHTNTHTMSRVNLKLQQLSLKQRDNGCNNKVTDQSDEAYGSPELVNHLELTYPFGASQWLGQEVILNSTH